MPSNFETLKKEVRAAAPAPYDETEGYATFSQALFIAAVAVAIALAYTLSYMLFLASSECLAWLSDAMPFSRDRLNFLAQLDERSAVSYLATVLSGFLLVPVILCANGVGYWKTVVAGRRCKRVTSLSLASAGPALLVFGVVFWIAFVFVPSGIDPRYPGNVRWFFWPIFPALGGLVLALLPSVLFQVCVLALKAALLAAGREEWFRESVD